MTELFDIVVSLSGTRTSFKHDDPKNKEFINLEKVDAKSKDLFAEISLPSKDYKGALLLKKDTIEHTGCGIARNKLENCIITNICNFNNSDKENELLSIKYPLTSVYLSSKYHKDIICMSSTKQLKNFFLLDTYLDKESSIQFKDTQLLLTFMDEREVSEEYLTLQMWVEDNEEILSAIKKTNEFNNISIANMFSLPTKELLKEIQKLTYPSIRIFIGNISNHTKQKGILLSKTRENLTMYKGSMILYQPNTSPNEDAFYYDQNEDLLYLGVFEKNIFKRGKIVKNPLEAEKMKLFTYDSKNEEIIKIKTLIDISKIIELIGYCDQSSTFTIKEHIYDEDTKKYINEKESEFNLISFCLSVFIKALSLDSDNIDKKFLMDKDYSNFIGELYETFLQIEDIIS